VTEELGKIERPEVDQFQGRRKLYLVPLVFSWRDSPQDYLDKFNLYWQQVREHIANLESRIGSVKLVFHESVTVAGDEGMDILQKLNPSSYQLVREKTLMGARLEVVEDRELIEESMDWERHLIMGFLSEKVAKIVSQYFTEASKKRYEYVAQRITDTFKEGDVAMLIIREGHLVQFPPDIEVFIVAPPALNDIHRWLRDRQEQVDTETESNEDTQAEDQGPDPSP
jgi:hypothetical protein